MNIQSVALLVEAAKRVLNNYGGIMLPLYAMPDETILRIPARDLKRLRLSIEAVEQEIRKQAIQDLNDPDKSVEVQVGPMTVVFPKLPAWMGEGNPG
jgi:hypothetical protein